MVVLNFPVINKSFSLEEKDVCGKYSYDVLVSELTQHLDGFCNECQRWYSCPSSETHRCYYYNDPCHYLCQECHNGSNFELDLSKPAFTFLKLFFTILTRRKELYESKKENNENKTFSI